MSNLVTVNSGSAIDGSLKAGRVAISTDSTINPSSGGKTWYNMINPAEGYVFISDPKVQGYNDGSPIIYPTQTSLPADILAIINGLPDRVGSVLFDNVWDALSWLGHNGKYFLLDKTLNGIIAEGITMYMSPESLASYPQSGSTVYNLGGTPNGTLANGPVWNYDGYFDFDGTDDYLTLGSSAASLVQGKTAVTMGILFKLDTTASLRGLIGTLNYNCTKNLGLVAGGTTLQFYNDTTTCYSVNAPTSISTGKWIFAVGTYDGTTTRIYMIQDGTMSQNSGTSKSGATNTFASDFRVMGNEYSSYFTNGQCAQAFVYDRVLSEDEIWDLYFKSPIITDNLSYRWDASNLASYSRTSTTVTKTLYDSYPSGSINNGVEFHSEYGGYWEFDGVNDNIILEGSTDSFRLNQGENWTVNAWVRTPQVGSAIGDAPIMSNSQSGPVWSVFKIHNGKIGFSHYNNAWLTSSGSVDINDGDWHMLTWSNLGDGTMDLYVDGTLDIAGVDSALSAVNRIDAIGRSWSAYFNGDIANVQVNKGTSMNATQVAQQYNAEYSKFKSSRDITGGKVLDLDFANPDSYIGGTSITDVSSQTGTGTLTNGPIYTIDNGGILDLDGTDDYVMMDSDYPALEFQPQDPFTVLVWAKFTDISLSAAIVANMIAGSGYAGWDLWGDGSGRIAMHLITSWSANAMKLSVNFSPTIGKWYLVGYTYDGSAPTNSTGVSNSVDFYIDGEVNANGKTVNANGFNSTSETIPYTSAHRFKIGSRGTSTQGFIQGLSSDWTCGRVMVFDKKLTSSEIKNIYISQSPRYQVQIPRSVTDSLSFLTDFGDTTSYPRTGTTVYDRSGNGNNGTATNGPIWSFDNGGIYDFDGTDDYITFSNPTELRYVYTDNFSLEVWVNPDATSGFKHLIGKTYANYRLAQSGTGISFRLDANNITTSGGTLVAGEWTHIVATWDPTTFTAKVYQDGSQIASVTDNTVNWTDISANFQLGNSPGEVYYFNGKIALGKAYSKTLSPSEVLENYKSTRSRFGADGYVTSNLQLYLDSGDIDSFDNSNTTWSDLSGNSNNATLTNGPTFNPRVGGIINFDGTNDRADNTSAPLSAGQTQYTIEAVFKPESQKTQVVWEQNTSSLTSGRRVCMILISDGDGGFNGQSADRHDQLPYYVGKYQHWVITVDTNLSSNKIKMYVNGELYDQGNPSGTLNAGADKAAVGVKVSTNSEYFDGDIPLVRVYDDVLTAAEVSQNYKSVRNRFGLD